MDTEQLKSALDNLVKDPSLAPANGMTFCNIGVYRISELFAVPDFQLSVSGDPPMANVMCEILERSSNFKLIDTEGANNSALNGKFVLAVHPYAGHGHVAAVYPSPEMFYSPSWKKEVPFLANIGKRNGILPASEVFPVAKGEPSYYVYGETV